MKIYDLSNFNLFIFSEEGRVASIVNFISVDNTLCWCQMKQEALNEFKIQNLFYVFLNIL